MFGGRIQTILVSALLLGAMADCDDNVTGVIVHGSVTARVRGFPGNKPLPNATYTMVGTTVSGTADAEGVIHLGDLGQGDHALRISAPGYSPTLYSFYVDGSSSSDVHLQSDVPLAENSGALDLTIYSGIDGLPAAGARVDLHWVYFPSDFTGRGLSRGTFVVDDPAIPASVVLDASGKAFVPNMPVSTFMVSMSHDVNGDGVQDAYLTDDVTLIPSGPTHATFTTWLDTYSTRFQSSNIPFYGSTFSDSLAYYVFSGAMDTSLVHTYVTVKTVDLVEVPVVQRWVTPVRLEVGLPASTLVAQSVYTVSVTVRAANSAPVYVPVFAFTWEPREL